MRRKKYEYNIKPMTKNEKIGKHFLRGLLYTGIFATGIYIGYSCDISKMKEYSINDLEKNIKKIGKIITHKKDTSLGWLVDKIDRLKE